MDGIIEGHHGILLHVEEHLAVVGIGNALFPDVGVVKVEESVASHPGIVGLVFLHIHHLNRHGTCLGHQLSGIVAVLLAGKGTQADGIGRGGIQPLDGHRGYSGCGAAHLGEVFILATLDFDAETLLATGVVTPGQAEAVDHTLGNLHTHRGAEMELDVALGDAVDIVLDIGIAVVGERHGIVGVGIGSVGLLPFIGHTVAVAVGTCSSLPHIPG